MTGRITRGIGLLVVLVLLPEWAAAQAGNSVSGSVVDESGGVVVGAVVTLVSPAGSRETVTGPSGVFRFSALSDQPYQLSVSVQGFAPAMRPVVVAGGDVVVPPIVLAVAGLGETVVVSGSRVEMRLLDSPAAVTVISPSTIRASHAQNYGDLLRAVPGLNVIQLSARDVNVTGRQATGVLATSQLTLLDGRSLYLDFYGFVLWDAISVDPGDIKQIEVVRGPASAVWGANALSGAVNIITKSSRETAGTTRVVLGTGVFDRDAGSGEGRGPGATFNAGVSTSHAVNDRWAYRVSAGYFNADAYARPVGQIPIVADPRDPTGATTVGGANYPSDGEGQFGSAFTNEGTSQPKFDLRVDQDTRHAHVTYAAGVAGTSGMIYTGSGPFRIQSGSMMSYARMNYARGLFKLNVFANLVDAEAVNQIVIDPSTARPIELDFTTQTFDVESGHGVVLGGRHVLAYGGNYRRNNFEVSLAPDARDRNEFGAYLQDETTLGRVRLSLGARVDKFGSLPDPVFSPRLAVTFQPWPAHSLRMSFNRAFRSPSAINNYIDERLLTPVDLSPLAPLLPPPLRPLATPRFPLVVKVVGSELPIGDTPQPDMRQESVTAYEWAYIGTFRGRTTVGVNFYVNDFDNQIYFVDLPYDADPYTAANPPPGWLLPPVVLTQMAQLGVYLPRTAFTYSNLGPTRQKGFELSLDERLHAGLSVSANYSWQSDPTVLESPTPFPSSELSFPPTHRLNAAASYDGPRFLGSLSANYAASAFWSDVLTAPYHGFTDAYTLVNLSAGVKFRSGRVTALLKSTNVLNRTVQQHIFGDLLRRSVTAELRLEL